MGKEKEEKLKYLNLDKIIESFDKHSDVEKAANEIKKFSDKYDALILEEAKDISQNFYDFMKAGIVDKVADGDLANIDITKVTVGQHKDKIDKTLIELAESELKHLDKRHYEAVTKHLSEDKRNDYILTRYAMSLGLRSSEALTNLVENSSSKTIQEFLNELTEFRSHFQKGAAEYRLSHARSSLGHNLKQEDVLEYVHTKVPKKGFNVDMDILHKHDHLSIVEGIVQDYMNNKLDEKKHRKFGITGNYKAKK
jgi:hypothetical protein